MKIQTLINGHYLRPDRYSDQIIYYSFYPLFNRGLPSADLLYGNLILLDFSYLWFECNTVKYKINSEQISYRAPHNGSLLQIEWRNILEFWIKAAKYNQIHCILPTFPEFEKAMTKHSQALDLSPQLLHNLQQLTSATPYQLAEQGFAYSLNDAEHLDLKAEQYASSNKPLVDNCSCSVCQKHTQGYIHHLLNVGEYQAIVLLMKHNHHINSNNLLKKEVYLDVDTNRLC